MEYNNLPDDEFLHAEHPLPNLNERTLRSKLATRYDGSMIGGAWNVPGLLLRSIAAEHLPGVRIDMTRYSYQIDYNVMFGPNDPVCANGHPRYDLDPHYNHRPYHQLIDEPREYVMGLRWPYYYNADTDSYQWICDVCAAPFGEPWTA